MDRGLPAPRPGLGLRPVSQCPRTPSGTLSAELLLAVLASRRRRLGREARLSPLAQAGPSSSSGAEVKTLRAPPNWFSGEIDFLPV